MPSWLGALNSKNVSWRNAKMLGGPDFVESYNDLFHGGEFSFKGKELIFKLHKRDYNIRRFVVKTDYIKKYFNIETNYFDWSNGLTFNNDGFCVEDNTMWGIPFTQGLQMQTYLLFRSYNESEKYGFKNMDIWEKLLRTMVGRG